MRRAIAAGVTSALLALLVPAIVSAQGDAKRGNDLYHKNCAVCHGEAGRGDGPAAASLAPKPRNLTDKSYMSSLDDKKLHEVIEKGGQAIGKSSLMAPMGAALSAQQIEDIVAYVRTLAK